MSKHFVVYIAFCEKKTSFLPVFSVGFFLGSPFLVPAGAAWGFEEMGRGKDGLSFCRCCHDRAKGLRKVVFFFEDGGELLWYEWFFWVIQYIVQQFCFRIFVFGCFFVLFDVGGMGDVVIHLKN